MNQDNFRHLATELSKLVTQEQMYVVDRIVDIHNNAEYRITPLINNEVVTVGRYEDQEGNFVDMCLFVGTEGECRRAIEILRDRYFVLSDGGEKACHYGSLEDCELYVKRHHVNGAIVNSKTYKSKYERNNHNPGRVVQQDG